MLKKQAKINKYIMASAVGLMLLLYLFPLYWLVISAFKSGEELYRFPPTFFPQDITLANIKTMWEVSTFLVNVKNSLILATGSTLLISVISLGAAYVLARYSSPWINVALLFILVMQMLPPALRTTPLYVLYSKVNLTDTYLGVILAMASKGVPFSIILYRVGFLAVPKSLEESSYIDGCTKFGSFFRIALPLVKNHIIVISILNFLQGMGEYVFSVSLLSSSEKLPATVGLTSFVGPNTTRWDLALPFAALYVVPIVVAFVFIQKYTAANLSAGAVKG